MTPPSRASVVRAQPCREVGFGVLKGVDEHLLHLFVGEAVGRLHLDGLLDVGPQLVRRHAQDAVRVYVECDLHLGHAARCGHDALQVELAERPVVAGFGALSLEHVDLDARLAVGRRREDFFLLRRDRRVA